jgi:diketogulonate reductase-like aldo/keto reductase
VSSLNVCPCLASLFDFWFFFELKIGWPPTPLEDSWRALEESVRRRWVRSIGVTNFDAQQPLSTSQEFFIA